MDNFKYLVDQEVVSKCKSLLIAKYAYLETDCGMLDQCLDFCLSNAFKSNKSIEEIVYRLILE